MSDFESAPDLPEGWRWTIKKVRGREQVHAEKKSGRAWESKAWWPVPKNATGWRRLKDIEWACRQNISDLKYQGLI